jgi:hypothetical protein
MHKFSGRIKVSEKVCDLVIYNKCGYRRTGCLARGVTEVHEIDSSEINCSLMSVYLAFFLFLNIDCQLLCCYYHRPMMSLKNTDKKILQREYERNVFASH